MSDIKAIFDAEAVQIIFDGGDNLIKAFISKLEDGEFALLAKEKSVLFEDKLIASTLKPLGNSVWLKSNIDLIRLAKERSGKFLPSEIAGLTESSFEVVIQCTINDCDLVTGQKFHSSLSKSEIAQRLGVKCHSVEDYFS